MLVWSQAFATREEAPCAERRIKGSNRAKMEALIRDDWREIQRLARGDKILSGAAAIARKRFRGLSRSSFDTSGRTIAAPD